MVANTIFVSTLSQIEMMTQVSHHTISFILMKIKKILAFDLPSVESDMIGGPETIVSGWKQIRQEMNNSSSTYSWVLGGRRNRNHGRKESIFCPSSESKCCYVKSSLTWSCETRKYDRSRGYRNKDLAALNLGHQTVNHSEHFIDPITGVHT